MQPSNPIPEVSKEYHAAKDIKYTLEQVKWLLSILPTLRDGKYPSDPKETGYHDNGFNHPVNPHAPFETAAIIAAELDARGAVCGDDWWLTQLVYTYNHPWHNLGMDEDEIYQRTSNCLKWLTGRDRKRGEYKNWKKVSNFRANVTKLVYKAFDND